MKGLNYLRFNFRTFVIIDIFQLNNIKLKHITYIIYLQIRVSIWIFLIQHP